MEREAIEKKKQALYDELKGYGKVAIAFSAGVDSTYLLMAAVEALGKDQVLAIVGISDFMPENEQKEAIAFCEEQQIALEKVRANTLEIPGVAENPQNRCYLCKRALFSAFWNVAKQQGFTYLLEGSNKDDEGDYRPGMQAVRELEVGSPMQKVGLTKAEIRALSKEMGLKTHDKPSYACLASRIAYGEQLDKRRLAMVEKSEAFLHQLGFVQCRVRMHGESGKELARLEFLPEDISTFMRPEIREQVIAKLTEVGFAYVTMDMRGFRSGSMNEVLRDKY